MSDISAKLATRISIAELDADDNAALVPRLEIEEAIAEVASLKEQNALLTAQVQEKHTALALLHDHARLFLVHYVPGRSVFDNSVSALYPPAISAQEPKA